MDPNEIPIPPEFVPPPEAPARPPVVTTGSASTAPPQQPSMLDRLRQQVMQDIMPNDAADMQRRARTFGAAMMGTPGSFFQGVAAGQQAIEQQRLGEQQARAQRVRSAEEDAYRQAQIQLKEAEQRYNQDPTNPRNRLYLAEAERAMGMANYYLQGGRGAGGAGTRGTYTERDIATRLANLPREASVNVDRILRNMPIQPQPAERQQLIAREAENLRASFLDELEAMGGQYAERAAALRAGRPAGPPQGPQGQRVQMPLTGTPRPAPTGQ